MALRRLHRLVLHQIASPKAPQCQSNLWSRRMIRTLYERHGARAERSLHMRLTRPQAAYAWTQIRDVLADHELPWGVDLMERRAADCNRDFWWQGQGGGGIQERERVKTNWSNKARAKLSCPNRASSCFGKFGNWSSMCKLCRTHPEVYGRDPCLAKFASGSGTASCYGPKDFLDYCWSRMCKHCRQDQVTFR